MSVERAGEAAARGEWKAAYDLLTEADADGLLGPAELPLLGEVAYASGHLDATIEAWERAHALAVEAGDSIAAAGAAVRVAMHLLLDTALMAPVRGWLARTERFLEGAEETPVHAWLAMVRTYERMLAGDVEGARPWAERAIDVGSRCEPAAAAIGRVAAARLRILDGDVDEGLALLDEAGVAAISGDLDPLSTGLVYCELVCALQGLGQYDIAEEWTDAMERWCQTNAIGSIHGRCRVHRAEILRLRGACGEAEHEAKVACEELRPYLRREMGWPLSELGRIRLRRGDIDGAEEALLAAHRAGWDPQPGLALVHLARGDVAAAATSIREALDHPGLVPSKERPPATDLQRAPLLEALVEIEVAAGDIRGARGAADELERVAERFRSKSLAAGAALARARVQLAEGDVAEAEGSSSESARLWHEIGAPYEGALARMVLAEALKANGHDEQADLELRAARTTLDQIEPAAGASAGTNVIRRDGDYWSVVFEGRAIHVKDLQGVRYLAQLLVNPGHEFHVLDLVAAETGQQVPPSDAGPHLDEAAKAAYGRRLAEIEDDIEQARVLEDDEREAQADAEREFLVREIARAVGLGGRDRRAGSASERARSGVTRAIRQGIARIAEHDAKLGEQLSACISTGTYCAFVPGPDVPARWTS
jgi:tetratricopeptide (TPR) repeat protein